MKTIVEIVHIWRIVGFGRADPVVVLLEITKGWWETIEESGGKHIVGHLVFDGLKVRLDLSHLVGILSHR